MVDADKTVEPRLPPFRQPALPPVAPPVITRHRSVDGHKKRIPTQTEQIGHNVLPHVVIENPYDDYDALVDLTVFWDETSIMIGKHARADNYVNVRRLWWQAVAPIGETVTPPHRDNPHVRQASWSRIHAESRGRHLHDRGTGAMFRQHTLAPGQQLVFAAGIGVWRDRSPRFKPPRNRWPLLERIGAVTFKHQLYPKEGKHQ